MKKTLLIGLILTTAFAVSGCNLKGYLDSRVINKTNETETIKPEIEDKIEEKQEEPDIEFSDVRYEDGKLKYAFTNKGETEIKYGVLFAIDTFDQRAYPSRDGWLDSKWTHNLRVETVLGMDAPDVELSIMPGITLEENLDITKYIGKMKEKETYQARKYFIDRENNISYMVRFQFEVGEGRIIDKVYAFMTAEPLEGNPISTIIPKPVIIPPKVVKPNVDTGETSEEPDNITDEDSDETAPASTAEDNGEDSGE